MNYNRLSNKNSLILLSSLIFHGFMFRFSNAYQENIFISSIFLIIIPSGCLIFLLFKYFQLKQKDKFELFRIVLFVIAIVLLAKEDLF